MKREDVKRAIEIDRALTVIANARKTGPPFNQNFSEYNCCVSEYRDGSGWKLDLIGGNLAKKILSAVYVVLDLEEQALKEELEAL